MMRRFALALGAAAMTAGTAVMPVPAGRAGAAEATVESGWWWKGNPGASAPLPGDAPLVNFPQPPPPAPAPPNAEGGLMVSADPSGESSVAAVRATIGAVALTLRVAEDGNVGGENAHLQACAATSPWAPADGGRWDDKPAQACDVAAGGGSVAGIPSEDGTSWTFPVLPLVRQGAVDVAIVPVADPEGLMAPFQLVFARPDAASFSLPPPDPPSEHPPQAPAPPSAAAVTVLGATAPVAPGAPVDSLSPGAGASSPTGDLPAVGGGGQAGATPSALPAVPSSLRSNDGRALGLLIILGGLAAAYTLSRRSLPAPRNLVAALVGRRSPPPEPEAAVGGLGRFARLRTGAPPRLR